MKTKRFFALALTVIMMFSLLPHAFAAEDITAMLAEYQKQARAMQQEVIAQQETARQDLALAQQQATQQVQQAQADMQKAYKQATCKHEWKRTYTEDKDETDGVHDEVTVCIDCEKELERVTVEDEKEQSATLRTALKAAPALRASATSGTCGDNLTWTMDDRGTVTISGTGPMTDYPVAGTSPWTNPEDDIRNNIYGVIVEEGVTSIGQNAFLDCRNLIYLKLPDSMKSIGDCAFSNSREISIEFGGTKEQWEKVEIKEGAIRYSISFDINPVTCSNTVNGSVTVNKSLAAKEDTVIVTVTPDHGFELDELKVLENGTIKLTTEKDASDKTKYTFTMPAAPVTVTATFKAGGAITTADELQAALNAGGTVTLTENIEYDPVQPIKVNTTTVTLELEKGVSFEFAGAGGINVERGNLTLTGSGTVKQLNVDGGSATISGGTVTSLNVDSGSAEVSGGTVNSLNVNSGSATISDGTVKNLDVDGGSATISGGTVDHLNVYSGSATIYGGTIHNLGGNGTIVFGVTAAANPAGSGTVTVAQTLAERGKPYKVTAAPLGGYEFVQWDSNAEVTFNDQSAAETTFTINSARSAVTVTATFKAIQKPTLTITAIDQTFVYNGQTQGEGDTAYKDPAEIAEKVTVEGLLEGDELTSIVLDGQGDKDVGKYELVPSGATVNGNSGSDKYEITYLPGTLTISTRPVTFTGKSETKKYTGNPITIDTLEVTETTKDAGLLSGHTHNVTFSATGTEPGKYTGTITEKVVILDSNNIDVTKNYEIKVVNGKLTIEQDVFTITCETSEHGKVEASKESAAEKETITLMASPDEGYELDKLTVTDASGNPVSVTNNEFTMPAENVTVTATFKLKTFTIKFVNDDGTELQSVTVAYGKTPAYTGETPEKPADTDYTYTFRGWEPAITSVTGEATYKATYTATKNEYTFTYEWAKDNSTVTAVRTCTNNPDLSVTEVVKTTSEGTAATCEAAGKVTYTAVFKNTAFEKQTKTVETPALGHKWKVSEELWAGDYSSVTVTFVCENDPTHTKKETAASSESISGSVVTYTAAITLDGKEFPFSKSVDIAGQGYVFTHTTQVWVKGSREGATFRVTRLGDDSWTYRLFTGIRVDGAPVSAYSKAPGSIILTLHPAYLESLSVGYHTLAVYFTDGEATADFLILPAGGSYYNNSTSERYTYVPPSNVPRTGDESNLALWGALAIVSAAGIALLIVRKRKKT